MINSVESNRVAIIGEIVQNFSFSHEYHGVGIFFADIGVKRFSKYIDTIPVMVSERIIDVDKYHTGMKISIKGQYRSRNKYEDGKRRLMLYVLAGEIKPIDDVEEYDTYNQIFLNGYIYKEPIYRKTPLGRHITDLFIAVNRPNGKADYIPCICWEKNARYVSQLPIGAKCMVWGRIQSREYMKRLPDGQISKRIAYEVSVNEVETEEFEDESKG